MKRILPLILSLLLCLLCACSTHENTEDKVIIETLVKYGEEFANYDNPAQEIAWSLAQVLNERLHQSNIELNPSEFDLEKYDINTEISEFEEELEICAIVCHPHLISSGQFHGGAWIRVAWSSKTQELRNIYIQSNIADMDNEELVSYIFHNSTLQGVSDVYDEVMNVASVEIPRYTIRISKNVVSFELPGILGGVQRNIDFLPYSVQIKNGELYYSTGERVEFDSVWVFDPVGS